MKIVAGELSFDTIGEETMSDRTTHSRQIAQHQLGVVSAGTLGITADTVIETWLLAVEHDGQQIRETGANLRGHDNVLSVLPVVAESQPIACLIMIEGTHVRMSLSHLRQFVIPVEFEHSLRANSRSILIFIGENGLLIIGRDGNLDGEITRTGTRRFVTLVSSRSLVH